MKTVINVVLGLAAISFILGVISRFTLKPLPLAPCGLEAKALLDLTNVCLLVAAVLLLKILTKGK
jgi:hypothetical protein